MKPAVKRIVDFRCEDSLRAVLRPDPLRATLLRAGRPIAQAPVADTSPRVLVLAEVCDGKLEISAAEAVGCARWIGGRTEVVLLSRGDPGLVVVAGQIQGVTGVVEIEAAEPALLAPRIAELVRSCGSSHVLASTSAYGKALMARLAEHLGVTVVPNVMRVVSPTVFAHPLARRVIATVETVDRPVLATVLAGAFDPGMLPNIPSWRSRVP